MHVRKQQTVHSFNKLWLQLKTVKWAAYDSEVDRLGIFEMGRSKESVESEISNSIAAGLVLVLTSDYTTSKS